MQLETCSNHNFLNEIEMKGRSWLTLTEQVFSKIGDETLPQFREVRRALLCTLSKFVF